MKDIKEIKMHLKDMEEREVKRRHRLGCEHVGNAKEKDEGSSKINRTNEQEKLLHFK